MASFRLHVLGPISLVASNGEQLDAVLAQPRRIALLAYLATQARNGYVRRDALLLHFWPDNDQEKARGALRQALYVLRRALGEATLISRGTEEIGISSEHLWCDATAFEHAVTGRDFAGALELYRGDFLESFFISEAPEFEQWMHQEQTRLRLLAANAAREVAALQEEAGRLRDAASTLERAIALSSSSDERTVQRLLSLLDRAGDRAGALRAYESFARTMQNEFGVEPAAETRSLYAAIRARESVVGDVPAAHAAQISPPIAVPSAASPPPTLVREPVSALPARRWWVRWAPGVFAAIALAAVVWYGGTRPAGATTDANERLAILPFDVSGGSEHEVLREGLMDMLSTGLDGVGGFHTIDPNAVLSAQREGRRRAAEEGEAIANRLQARYYLRGRVMESAGRLRVNATLYDRTRGSNPVTTVSRESSADSLFALVDDVVADLLVSSHPAPIVRIHATAAVTTSSLPALKAYLEGESAWRAGRTKLAFEAFSRAVNIDTTFALAGYRMSAISPWAAGGLQPAAGVAERALRHSARLTERDRLLLEAHLSYLAGDRKETERRYRAIVERYPDEIDAWYQLGETRFNLASDTDAPISDARSAFEHVFALDPHHLQAVLHLTRIAAAEGRVADVDSFARRELEILPEGAPSEGRVHQAFAHGAGTRAQLLRDFDRDPRPFQLATWVAAIWAQDFDAALHLCQRVARTARRNDERTRDNLSVAELYIIQGRIGEARNTLRMLPDTAVALMWNSFATVLPFRSTSAGELRAARERLERGTPNDLHSVITFPATAVYEPWRQHIRLYLLGLMDVQLDDPASARSRAELLERLSVPSGPGAAEFARELTQSVRAQALAREGKRDAAIKLLDATPTAKPPQFRNFFTRRLNRFLLAEMLFAAGRYHEALPLFGSFDRHSLNTVIFASPSHYRRAQIYARQGNTAKAVEHYEQFLKRWGAADTELQPQVAEAQRQLLQLKRSVLTPRSIL